MRVERTRDPEYIPTPSPQGNLIGETSDTHQPAQLAIRWVNSSNRSSELNGLTTHINVDENVVVAAEVAVRHESMHKSATHPQLP